LEDVLPVIFQVILVRNPVTITLLALLLCIPVFLFSRNTLVEQRGMRFDLYPRYVGTQAFWNGESPYAQTVTDRIQLGMYGELQPADADQQRFAHPAYSAVFLAPLLALSADTAIALWITLQFVALLATPFLWLRILNWRPAPLTFLLLLIGLVFIFRYPILSYLWGQFTGGIVFLFSLAILLLKHKRPVWTGVALALAAVPPSISGPLTVLVLGGYALNGKHWRAAGVFIAILAITSLIAILRIGWWLPDFLAGVSAYADYAHPVWALDYLPALLRPLSVIGLAALIVWLFWRWRAAARDSTQAATEWQRQLDFICGAILVTLLLVPQTGNYYLVLCIPILMITLYRLRSDKQWRWLGYALVIIAVLSPWLWLLLGLPDVETLVTPLLVGLAWGVSLIRKAS
jgi:hypothetical protein